MGMTQWVEEMLIQRADLISQEVRSGKKRGMVGVDKKHAGDLWTLNPTHLWTPWPQSLSQTGKHRGNGNTEGKLAQWNRHTFQSWRRKKKSRAADWDEKWSSESRMIKGSTRILLATMWAASLCGREIQKGGGAVLLTLPRGSTKDKAAASNQTAREAESAKPQCAFIYPSPTPHEQKITSHQSGFALHGWHANPRTHCGEYVQMRHDSTHMVKDGQEPFSVGGFRVIWEGIISPWSLHQSLSMCVRIRVCLCACLYLHTKMQMAVFPLLERMHHESTLAACHQYCFTKSSSSKHNWVWCF